MNRLYTKRRNVKNQVQPTFKFKRMSNGDILIRQNGLKLQLPLFFLLIFFYFWYKALLFSPASRSDGFVDVLIQRITQEPFIIIFLVMPLVMFAMSAKQLLRFGRTSFRFDAVKQLLYFNNKAICNFDDIDKITINYADSSSYGSILLLTHDNNNRTIYNSKDYADLSLRANELAAFVHAPLEIDVAQ